MSTEPDNPDIDTNETTGTYGHVRIEAYETAMFDLLGEVWDRANDEQKLFVTQLLDPSSVSESHNTSVRGQHELIVRLLDREDTEDGNAGWLALGDNNSTAPTYENDVLNNELYRARVTNSDNRGTELRLTTFLGADEANSIDYIREIGLSTDEEPGTGHLLNHSLIPPQPKTSSVALTINVTLGFRPVSA